jgi:hypothetical protein
MNLISDNGPPLWSEFLAIDPEVVGSIPGASRFSEKQRVWNGVHSASWGQLRSYLEGKVAAPIYKTEINNRRNLLRWPCDTLYPQKLALTSPTSGGRSVGIVRSRTKATEFSLVLSLIMYTLCNDALFVTHHTIIHFNTAPVMDDPWTVEVSVLTGSQERLCILHSCCMVYSVIFVTVTLQQHVPINRHSYTANKHNINLCRITSRHSFRCLQSLSLFHQPTPNTNTKQ